MWISSNLDGSRKNPLSTSDFRLYHIKDESMKVLTLANSEFSLNSTSFNIKVQTLSQNLYVFNFSALKWSLVLTRVARALLIDLSNWIRTARAKAGVSIWSWRSSSRHSFTEMIAGFFRTNSFLNSLQTLNYAGAQYQYYWIKIKDLMYTSTVISYFQTLIPHASLI